jgi:glycosyltransferase involved in cell wall biosynthesis
LPFWLEVARVPRDQCHRRLPNMSSLANPVEYSVLIRTHNSESTLPETVASLNGQTTPPHQYVVVDSGSTDRTLSCIPVSSVVHNYVGKEFNYSESLNQGLQFVSSNYVLIISSHTSLQRRDAVEYALTLIRSDEKIAAAYFCIESTGALRHELIDKQTFDGFNGLWNTCALIKVPLLRRRSFRPDVFTAEDQEWASWLFYDEGKATARISGGGMVIRNPRYQSLRKKANEYVSVAYFSNRKLLAWFRIARFGLRSVSPIRNRSLKERWFYLSLALRLAACHFFKPKSRSRYF